MNNIVIDLNYAKNQRESILSSQKHNNNNINNQLEIFSVPMKLIIDLYIDLAHVAVSLDEDLDNKDTRDILLGNLTMILNRMSDIAIFLNIDLIVEVEKPKVKDLEIILNSLFNSVSMLNYKKETARSKMKNRIIPLFAELVYNLGFSLNDLKEYYFKKDDNFILNLEKEISDLKEQFKTYELIRAINLLTDEMIEKQQYEEFKRFSRQNKRECLL